MQPEARSEETPYGYFGGAMHTMPRTDHGRLDVGQPRLRHLRDPDRDRALCGARIDRHCAPPPEADQCVVCVDLARLGRFAAR